MCVWSINTFLVSLTVFRLNSIFLILLQCMALLLQTMEFGTDIIVQITVLN
jgi:hypothetical protein